MASDDELFDQILMVCGTDNDRLEKLAKQLSAHVAQRRAADFVGLLHDATAKLKAKLGDGEFVVNAENLRGLGMEFLAQFRKE